MYIADIMDIIRMIQPWLEEEIDDGKKYAMAALQIRDHHPDIAGELVEISTEELGHMARLHAILAKLIDAYRDEKGDPPAPMLAVYDYLHRQQIAKAAEVKNLQAMFTSK